MESFLGTRSVVGRGGVSFSLLNQWFGRVVGSRRARIRVPGLEADVAIEDVGGDGRELRASVDAAYRAKYGRYGETTVERMVTDDAAAATLRLVPQQGARPDEH